MYLNTNRVTLNSWLPRPFYERLKNKTKKSVYGKQPFISDWKDFYSTMIRNSDILYGIKLHIQADAQGTLYLYYDGKNI